MKAVILAGGYGTRLSEETILKPKPMIEIGGKPMLWHIMKLYSHYGINEFIICLGYKGYLIKEYFINYRYHASDVTVELESNNVLIHKSKVENWKITLVETGIDTMTAGRLKKVSSYIKDDECFCLTYGDGLCDVDINDEIEFHKKNKADATILAVQPSGKFGALEINDSNQVISFIEKPPGDGFYINGGFFVCSSKVLEYIPEDCENIPWEREPLEILAREGRMQAYKHKGFWQCMDTLRDKTLLENLWNRGQAPWKIWGKTQQVQCNV